MGHRRIIGILFLVVCGICVGCEQTTDATSQQGQHKQVAGEVDTASPDDLSASDIQNQVLTKPSADTSIQENMAIADTKKQELSGSFTKLEWGDYPHIHIMDDDGTAHTYWVKEDMPANMFTPLELPENEGKKVDYSVETVTRYFPEGGSEMEVEQITAIKFVL